MQIVKVSTAFTAIVGPILDSTGVEYTSAVIGDLSISKNGTEAAMASAATLTHVSNGYYTLVTTTGNTDTLGRLDIRCNKSTYQMPPVRYSVLASAAFDTLITNGTLASTTSGRTIVTDAAGLVDANTVKVGPTGSGTAQTARDLGTSVLLSSGTGTGQVKLASGYIAPNWGDVGNPTTTVNLSGTTTSVVTTATNLTNAPGAGDLTATMKTSVQTASAAAITAAALATAANLATLQTTANTINTNVAAYSTQLLSGACSASGATVTPSVGFAASLVNPGTHIRVHSSGGAYHFSRVLEADGTTITMAEGIPGGGFTADSFSVWMLPLLDPQGGIMVETYYSPEYGIVDADVFIYETAIAIWTQDFDGSSLLDRIDAILEDTSAFSTGSSPTTLASTTIATLTSQTVFTLSAGSSDNDAYTNKAIAIITDQSNPNQKTIASVSDYVGSTKTVTLASNPAFTIATGDSVAILADISIAAANSVTISPVVSILTAGGELVSQPIKVTAGDTFGDTFTILDANLDPINDLGDTFELVVYKLPAKTTVLFTISGLTAGGSGGNQVPFIIPDTNTATAGTYWYRLHNVTKDKTRAKNSFVIEN